MEKEKEALEQRIRKISDSLDSIHNLLQEAYFIEDGVWSEISDNMILPKKKKEREELLRRLAKKNFPDVVSSIQELDASMQGIGLFVENVKSDLDSVYDELGDIESLQEEIEDKKRELDM